MARIRTIKPDFFTSEDIVSLSPLARLLYIAIWCEADKEGRLVWKPFTFKLRYLPGDNCDAHALCAEIVERGLVRLYGDGYAVIPAFASHQHINPRESDSVLPSPDDFQGVAPRERRVNDASARVDDAQGGKERKGREGKGKEGIEDTVSPLPRAPDPDRATSKPGAVCVVLKSEGIASVNPGHAGLLSVLQSGATLADFVAAAGLAKEAQKPTFAYVLGIVKNLLSEGQKVVAIGAKNSSNRKPSAESFRERDARLARERWEQETGRVHPDHAPPPSVAGGVVLGGDVIEAQVHEVQGVEHEH